MDTLLASPFLPDNPEHSPQSNQFDISPNPGSPYDDFAFAPDSAHFPHTPSYNGSYQNSPYSSYSDLPPFDGADDFALFPDGTAGLTINDDTYDPSDYDISNTTGLTFDEQLLHSFERPTVSVTAPMYDHQKSAAQDHSSPASSSGADDGRRSRASSTSSYRHPNSPPMDFAQNFEGLRFDSPHYPNMGLPSIMDRTSPPMQKPPSPPQLVIPDSTNSPAPGTPPIINAPDGDGDMMSSGPRLHIVPATPVSGGGGTAQPVPFQDTLASLSAGSQSSVQQSDAANWDHQHHPSATNPSSLSQGLAAHSQFSDQSQSFYSGSSLDAGAGMGYGPSADTQLTHSNTSDAHLQQPRQSQTHYLVPQPVQRSRSLSDTSLRPPIWDTLPIGGGMQQRGPGGTVNMNDVLPGPGPSSASPSPAPQMRHPSSAGPHQTSFNQSGMGGPSQGMNTLQPQRLGPNFTFGMPGGSSAGMQPGMNLAPNDYLSPDVGTSLRRVKSESMRHRQVRSEDLSYLTPGQPGGGGMYFPPASSTARQYLHPTERVPQIRGHQRRLSSPQRGVGLDPVGNGGWSSASSQRASPYPSPSASPRPGYGALPELSGLPASGGMGMMGGASMQGMIGVPGPRRMNMQVDVGMNPGVELPLNVAKQNVTTPSTADASQKRRKQPANFQCPVPGCGSTFTRHFNLKGHLRSHAEEKPYQCKWPGCGKGFARQHDCKRHEQLHLNIRPYPCEGCKKNFARMDALNRHLRSEGGAECRKIQEEITAPADGQADAAAIAGGPVLTAMKPDPDGWQGSGGLMM